MAQGTGAATQAADERRRWVALYVLCAGVLMIVLDATIVNVALPSIQEDLGFTQASLAWVVNAYLIAFGGLLLLAGRLGDLVGGRSIFLGGLALFTVASLACGLASSREALVTARFLQGAGGAATAAVILGLIVRMFPDPRDRGRAIGVYSFVASAGGAVGLLVGGVITEVIDWHWIFYVNVPLGLLTAVAAVRLVERDEGIGLRRGADVPGAVLVTSALMLGVYTIVQPAATLGWTAQRTLVLGAVSVALLAAFVLREHTARTPLMPLRLFRSRITSGANIVQLLVVPGMFGQFFLGALYLERVLGYSALEIGLAFLPETVIMAVLSVRVTDRIAARIGALRTFLPGTLLVLAGLALLAIAPADGDYVRDLLPAVTLFGFGAGLAFPSMMSLAMSRVPNEDAGLASGLLNTTAQVGGAVGLAVFVTISASRTAERLDGGASLAVARTDGYHLAFWVAAGLVVVGAAVATWAFRVPPSEPEQEPATTDAADTTLTAH